MRTLLLTLGVLVALAGPATASAGASALSFDGVDDRVDAGLDPTDWDTTTSRTWEAWVRTTSSEPQVVLSRGVQETPWSLSLDDGVPRIDLVRGLAGSTRHASAAVADGVWHHVAAVWEPAERLDIYVDGVKANGALRSHDDTGAPQSPARIITEVDPALEQPMSIGAASVDGNWSLHFEGDIDGVHYSQGAAHAIDFSPDPCPEAETRTLTLWTFSEGSGDTTATDGQTTTEALLLGGIAWTNGPACPPVESALSLDGVDDGVTAGLDPTATQTTTARTWEAWVRTTTSDNQVLIGRDGAWALATEGGIPVVTITDGLATSIRYSDASVDDGDWHHVAAVWEPGVRLDIYVDGALANGDLFSTDAAGDAEDPATILGEIDAVENEPMAIGHGLGTRFEGDIDGVRYSQGARYTDAFTPAPCPEPDAATIALWTFSEGSGTTTATQGMVTTDATLEGEPGWVEGPDCASPVSALSFDGINDRVVAGLDPTAAETAAARTWEAWIRTTSAETQVLVGRDDPWRLGMSGGVPVIAVQDGAAESVRHADVTVDDGGWHHVAAVWEPGTRLDIYVDGILENGALHSRDDSGASETPATVLAAIDEAADQPVNIGFATVFGDPALHFEGALDGIHYSIGARYTADFTPDTTPEADTDTIGLWTFSDADGDTTATEGQMTAPASLENYPVRVAGPEE